MADYDDVDDAWSYSFPPSTDLLPLSNQETSAAASGPDLLSASDKLQRVVGTTDSTSKSSSNDQQSPQKAVSAFKSEDSSLSSVDMLLSSEGVTKKEPYIGLGTSPPTPSIGLHSLQTSFMAKSQPAYPHTTREDASSVISSSSNSNGLAQLETFDDERNQNQVRFRGTVAENRKSSGENDRGIVDDVVASPKIIAYRKSKRTQSDGSAQNLLEAMAVPKPSYDPKLYVDEKFKDTKYHYTTVKRNMEFHQVFRSIDLTDRLLDDFSCALSREILLQGRVYISEKYICFNSSLLGWVTSLIIPQDDIIRFEKRSTAGIFPNAILVETKETKHTFASLITRDATYDLMKTVWEESTGKVMDESPELPVNDVVEEKELVEEANTDNISDYIMSIDEDNQNDGIDGDDDAEYEDENTYDDSAGAGGVHRVKVIQFKPDSKYISEGPSTHKPTEATDAINDLEKELCNEVINAPMGVVFEILFGSSNMDFQQRFLMQHSGSDVSDYGEFTPTEQDKSKLERSFHYTRSLNYRIGPQFTLCQVHELIERLNFDDYISVVTTVKTPDVPLGNSFSVKTKYRMNWAKDNKTNLQISFYVDWTGPSWIKSIIEKLTLAGQEATTVDLLEGLREEIKQVTYESMMEIQEQKEVSAEPPAPVVPSKALPPAPVAVETVVPTSSTQTLLYVLIGLLCMLYVTQLIQYRQLKEIKELLQNAK